MTSRPGRRRCTGEGALLSLHEDVDDCRGQGELDIFLLLRDDDIGALAELDGAAGDEVAGEAPEVDHGEVLDLRDLGDRWHRVGDRDGHRALAGFGPVVEGVLNYLRNT